MIDFRIHQKCPIQKKWDKGGIDETVDITPSRCYIWFHPVWAKVRIARTERPNGNCEGDTDMQIPTLGWTSTGTFTGKAPFAGIEPNGSKFSTSVMNFYVFDDEGKIIDDIAATGMLGILQGIGAGGQAVK